MIFKLKKIHSLLLRTFESYTGIIFAFLSALFFTFNGVIVKITGVRHGFDYILNNSILETFSVI